MESLDFFLENSRTWKITLVLDSPGKISVKVMHFSSGSNGKQSAMVEHPVRVCHILLYAELSATDYTL